MVFVSLSLCEAFLHCSPPPLFGVRERNIVVNDGRFFQAFLLSICLKSHRSGQQEIACSSSSFVQGQRKLCANRASNTRPASHMPSVSGARDAKASARLESMAERYLRECNTCRPVDEELGKLILTRVRGFLHPPCFRFVWVLLALSLLFMSRDVNRLHEAACW